MVSFGGHPFSFNARVPSPANAGRRYPPQVLTAAELEQLLRACSRRGAAGPRNRALIVVLWRVGLRVSEALALLPIDVDAQAGTVHVRDGKGHRDRVVGIDSQALAVVEGWLERRRRLGIARTRPLFCTISAGARGGPLSASYVRQALKALGRRAGIEKRVHPHGLRHTHAAELAGEGVGVHVIRKQLGHGSLATTDRYIDHLRPRDVIDAMQARSWPARAPTT